MKAVTLILLASLATATLSKPFGGKGKNDWGDMDMSFDFVMLFKNSDNSWNFKAIAQFIKSMNVDVLAGLLKGMFNSFMKAKSYSKKETIEMPEFVELEGESENYQVGNLIGANWACTSVGIEGETAAVDRTMFDRLFKYITENDIKMTAPVATKIEGNKATMCFYLPKKFQENYPTPQDKNVFILSKPTMKIFKLGAPLTGYNDEHFEEIGADLEKFIEEEGRHVNEYNKDFYILASYTDPTKSDNAYSEVWFVAKE